uniref:THAP-type domain-containing protein n=1 Tax=Heterorhabditis bacteriophora TaxID=37862 RepID=A0A1I7XKE5_HETBA
MGSEAQYFVLAPVYIWILLAIACIPIDLCQFHVCRVHFVDDKPTFENPTPTLMLKSTTVKTVAKRKISEELDFSKKKREESDDDDISCTLNSCNEMNSIKLDSTSKKIPVLELRSTVDSQKNGGTLESDINTEEESISDTNSLEIMSSSFLPKDNIQLSNVKGRVTETSCEQCMSHLPTIRNWNQLYVHLLMMVYYTKRTTTNLLQELIRSGKRSRFCIK